MQFDQVRRRELLTLLAGATVWPVAAQTQQAHTPVIGFLGGGFASGSQSIVTAFHQGLKRTGNVEGQNVKIEYRWAEGQYDRLPLS
jgi:putative tryptophan/tyrosine transport system substrate-binding protein